MKACIKFLSVLLVMTMCLSFMPPAHAIFIGVDESYVAPAKPTASPAPTEGTGAEAEPNQGGTAAVQGPGVGGITIPKPQGEEEIKYEYTVTTAAELRKALASVGFKGTVTLGDHITDLTYPLSIDSSLTLDLDGYTLGFQPGSKSYDYAVEISSNADEVFIINGTVSTETSSETAEDGTVTNLGYYHVIGSDAGELHLDGLVIEGQLLEAGSSFVKKDEESKGSIQVAEGTYPTDPTSYVDEELYTVTDNGNGTWTVAKKAVEGDEEADDGEKDGTAGNPDISTMLPGSMIPIGDPGAPDGSDGTGTEGGTDADAETNGTEGGTDPDAGANGADGTVTGGGDETLPGTEAELTDPVNGMVIPGLTQVVVPDQTINQENAAALEDYIRVCDKVTLEEDVAVDSLTTANSRNVEIDLNGHTLTVNGTMLISNIDSEVLIHSGTLNAKISNTGNLTLSGVTQAGIEKGLVGKLIDTLSGGSADVINNNRLTLTGDSVVGSVKVESGYVDLGAGTASSATVTGGSLLMNGGNVGPVSVTGGSLIVNSGSVGDVTVENGTLTVQGGSLNNVTLKGTSVLNVYAGAFASIKKERGAEISGDLVKSGTAQEIDKELLAEGYELNEEYGIMPLTVTGTPKITVGPASNLAENDGGLVYFSGDMTKNQPYFEFEYTSNDISDVIKKVEIHRYNATEDEAGPGVELILNTDFTWDGKKNGGTVTLLANSSTLQSLKPGAYTLSFTLIGYPTVIPYRIFIYPPITPIKTYYDNGKDEPGISYQITGMDVVPNLVPDKVSFDKITNQNQTTMVITEGDEYIIDGDTITLLPSFLGPQDDGPYYICLWYGNSRVTLPISIGEAPTVKPSSRDWVYTLDKDDAGVKFTVSTNSNSFTSLVGSGTLSATPEDYSISSDGRTITVKVSFLKELVRRATGEGHGNNTLTFMTTLGPVTGNVNVKPGIWAVDGEDDHKRGTDKGLVYEASAPFDETYIPDINDKEILPEDYDGYYTEGNRLYFNSGFLNQRKAGTFKVYMRVSYTDTASKLREPVLTTYFSINGSSARPSSSGSGTSPATGDENNPLVWLAVLALSGGAAVALLPRKKKQDQGE